MRVLIRYLIAIAAIMAFTSTASAQVTVAEWNFNAATSPGNASTGTGTTSGAFFPFASSLPLQNGSPNDTNPVIVNGGPNNASAPRSGPNPGEASGGRQFGISTSLAGFGTPTVIWDVLAGYRTSRYYQITATTDGVNFNPVPTGTGSSGSNAFGSFTVSNDGLISIEAVDGLIDTDDGVGYLNDLSYSFPGGSAFDNNPDFGIRIAAVWEPGGSDFVSSFAGTDATDTVSGYIRDTSLGGNLARYDLVRVVGTVPEPTSLVLAAFGMMLAGVRRRR